MTLPTETSHPPSHTEKPARSEAIDLLRGGVMVLMALDHTRDFFSGARGSPTDLATTTPALFFTRWITHFCAPVFVLLAGTAAFLSGASGRSGAALTRFLLSRGAWLVLLELTAVRFGWMFNVNYRFVLLQVIWAIGWSMIALSALCRLPSRVVGAIGLAMCAAHNLADGFHPHRALWNLLHESAPLALGPTRVYVAYPLIPWVGVMAMGYAMGEWMKLAAPERQRRWRTAGALALGLFVLLRGLNLYGDPSPWHPQATPLFTVMAVLNCEKYPPSLAYLLMTLGPALWVLAWADTLGAGTPWVRRQLVSFGRVPLFYYLLHLPLIHGMALLYRVARGSDPRFGLVGVYLAWAVAIALLAWPCRWFAEVKRRSRAPWLSYL